MNSVATDRFSLIQERTNSGYRQRLMELGEISQEIIQTHLAPLVHVHSGTLSIENAIDIPILLKNYKSLNFDDLATHFIFYLEGSDSRHYLLQVQASETSQGFDLFIGSSSVSRVADPADPDRYSLSHAPTSDLAEHHSFTNESVDRAYIVGIRRISAIIKLRIKEDNQKRFAYSPNLDSSRLVIKNSPLSTGAHGSHDGTEN